MRGIVIRTYWPYHHWVWIEESSPFYLYGPISQMINLPQLCLHYILYATPLRFRKELSTEKVMMPILCWQFLSASPEWPKVQKEKFKRLTPSPGNVVDAHKKLLIPVTALITQWTDQWLIRQSQKFKWWLNTIKYLHSKYFLSLRNVNYTIKRVIQELPVVYMQ